MPGFVHHDCLGLGGHLERGGLVVAVGVEVNPIHAQQGAGRPARADGQTLRLTPAARRLLSALAGFLRKQTAHSFCGIDTHVFNIQTLFLVKAIAMFNVSAQTQSS